MSHNSRSFFRIIALTLTLALAGYPVLAQDIMKVAPQGRKVLIENDRVRMIEATLKPGDKEPMHSHPAYIFYALTPLKVRITLPDGTTSETEFKAGDAAWRDGATHTGENIGKAEGRYSSSNSRTTRRRSVSNREMEST